MTDRKLLPIPEKLVVLTFDDGCRSDLEFVMPLLREYGFGATFFHSDAFLLDETIKDEYYGTWEDAQKIDEAGFEIGNHTKSHVWVPDLSKSELLAELEYVENRCKEYGIRMPTTFCYPAWGWDKDSMEVLRERGYPFARRGVAPEYPDNDRGGRGPVYDPTEDDPLLVPCTGYSGPDWGFDDFVWALEQGGGGKIPVFAFHGVPDLNHWWVNTDPDDFRKYMDYLRTNDYTVIAMRDLARYIDPAIHPDDPFEPIDRRLGSARGNWSIKKPMAGVYKPKI